MSLADVMRPAIRHASRGFTVTPSLSDCIESAAADLVKDKLAAARLKKEQQPAPAKAQDHWLGIAFASHPPDAARVQFFQAAANQR
jgi:gamma-glutamyltranspeptidase